MTTKKKAEQRAAVKKVATKKAAAKAASRKWGAGELLGRMVRLDPKKLERIMIAALRKAGMHRGGAAADLGVSHAAISRWITRLGIGDQVAELEQRALKEGWHHGRRGGRPLGATDSVERRPRSDRGVPRGPRRSRRGPRRARPRARGKAGNVDILERFRRAAKKLIDG